jgi:hypothetical protein
MNQQEKIQLDHEQSDLLRELSNRSDDIVSIIDLHLRKCEFSAFKYKEQECYEDLMRVKKSYNILRTFFNSLNKTQYPH